MSRLRGSLFTAWLGLTAACGSDPLDPPVEEPEDPPRDALGWQILVNSPVSEDLGRHDDLIFVTPDLGWLVNIRGEIHRTTDGGESWELVHSDPSVLFRSVGFASAEVGWAGNLNGFTTPDPQRSLYETRDGGDTWTNISDRIVGPEPAGICGLWVVDEHTAYGVGRWHGPAVFIRTADGGQTWQSTDLSPAVDGLVDVYFFDRNRGLIIGGRGVGPSETEQAASVTVILGTTDGGTTWTPRYEADRLGTWGWKFSFPTPNIGYAAEQGPRFDGTVLKTVDGGLTWQELHVGDSLGFSGIGFADSNLGWVGSDSRAFETQDGGATWEPVNLGSSLNRFRMMGDYGYASGRNVYRWQR